MTSTPSAACTVPTRVQPSGSFAADLHARIGELVDQVDQLAPAYQNAEPFPHIAIDDFLPAHLVDALQDAFPGPGSDVWTKLPTEDQKGKYAAQDEGRFPELLRSLIHELNAGPFVAFLERLTGVEELIADAKLSGGGLHRTESGGKLSVHVDFSHHPANGLNRRLNLLLYLTPEWQDDYGGHLELWSWGDDKRPEAKILPKFNRCAIFSTSPWSYHGQPEPLTCPPELARQSVALYYFSNGRPDHEAMEHNTSFHSRPDEEAPLGTRLVRAASSGLVRDLLPPVVYRGLRRAWNRRTEST
ncbi:MAG: 2OG-Fe(II) oxygenase [Acidobacteriota bacterium]